MWISKTIGLLVVLLVSTCYGQTAVKDSEYSSSESRETSGRSKNDFLSTISNPNKEPEIPTPQAQTQGRERDWSPFSNNNPNSLEDERLRDRDRNRDIFRDRDRAQFPSSNTNNNDQDSRFGFGRNPRPQDPFSNPNFTTNRNFGVDSRPRLPDNNVFQNQRPQTSLNPGFNPFGINGFNRNTVIREP